MRHANRITGSLFCIVQALPFASLCLAQFTTVIDIPPDPAPSSIGSDTQLNIFEGGVLPSSSGDRFQAGLPDGSSTNVEVNILGGTANFIVANAGSTVNIVQGAVEVFTGNSGSALNVLGGSVNGRAANSLINISGGTVLNNFDARERSIITVSGGIIDFAFSVRGESTLNVSGGVFGPLAHVTESLANISGGTFAERFFTRTGSLVNISGGTFGRGFTAEEGSTVNISGGKIGPGFEAESGSLVTITGGEIDRSFFAEAGSEVNVSGGLVRGFRAETGSSATIIGGEFSVDGSTAGNQTVAVETVLSGTFEDGTTFIFSGRQFSLTLISIPLPPPDLVPAIVDSVTKVSGLRQGQSLTLVDGGVIPDDFSVVSATLRVAGGQVGTRLKAVESNISISGGTLVGNSVLYHSDVAISGGEIGEDFSTNGGTISITGGTINKHFSPGGHVTVAGGTFVGEFSALGTDSVELIGSEFSLDGKQIEGLSAPGESIILSERGGRLLTGVFADGSPFDFILNSDFVFDDDPDETQQDVFGDDTVLRLTLIPEPRSTMLILIVAFLLAVGGARQFCHRCRQSH